ncbi:hypothetical protein [Ferruginibacter sp. SUN106]|uniref:hypothetical protein n=1 Tax=Ferruginibacter sp. SUN106 TaxID=2978348 RepID=UPI003D36ECF8
MKEVFDKLSSYNIFNYLLPGVLFVIISKHFTPYDFIQEDNLIGGFLYYFIGMVISRFGSLIVEPILKWISFLKFVDYNDYVQASKKDTKIELFSEVNNTYRTVLSLFVVLLLLRLYSIAEIKYDISTSVTLVILIGLILLMFLFSYRKQTNYLVKRVNTNKNSDVA